MTLCVLDGTPAGHPVGAAVRGALAAYAEHLGWPVRAFDLAGLDVADCVGDFNCWFRTPGICSINDPNRDIARAIVLSDLLVLVTPVTFGGYSSDLKKALDHVVQVISPLFEMVDGEMHHQRRYDRHPSLVGIGVADAPDGGAERVFRTIVARNALNLHNAHHASGVIRAGLGRAEIAAAVEHLLDAHDGLPHVARLELGPRAGEWAGGLPPPKTALLLAGSPRGEVSTSASLARYARARLEDAGVRCDTVQVRAALRSADACARVLDAAGAADLVLLSCPLYVDCLPAPVIRLLERIAARRRGGPGAPRQGPAQRLAALVQCGYAEPRHNDTALAVCRQFAREAGYAWAGGLGLGGGHGLVSSRPVESLGRLGARLRQALDLAAAALAAGGPIPHEAIVLLERPFMPPALYAFVANRVWHREARRRGVKGRLLDRPYAG